MQTSRDTLPSEESHEHKSFPGKGEEIDMTMMVGGVKSKDRRLRECEQMAGRKATMAGQMITYDPHKKHSPVKQVLSPSLSLPTKPCRKISWAGGRL